MGFRYVRIERWVDCIRSGEPMDVNWRGTWWLSHCSATAIRSIELWGLTIYKGGRD